MGQIRKILIAQVKRHIQILVCLTIGLSLIQCQNTAIKKPPRILIWGGDTQIETYKILLEHVHSFAQSGVYKVITSNDESYLLEDSLRNISALIFLNEPNQLSASNQRNIERFFQSGGGLSLPIAPINPFQWPWYYQIVTPQNRDSLGFLDQQIVLWDSGYQQMPREVIFTDLKRIIGDNTWDPTGITAAKAPQRERFAITVLDDKVNEPMEVAVLPSGRVLFIEREGKVKLYDPVVKKTKTVAELQVNTSGNYEDGLLGLVLDPHYEKNNWIYFFYSPQGDTPVQYVSRFRFAYEDSLILASEKVVLEIPVQRETCCHSGGGLEFGPDGLLYISTGDNTSSKESDGFSPLDERPGRSPFDAQKSSSNTHDLRGKILRIAPQLDGTYTVPEGNLFPKHGRGGRPEIYVMGCRNPFRFSIDAKTGFLYWGDVGPDGGKDGPQGPQSYDEWNQARGPGNYGWPYFVADNKAYTKFDFATSEVGPLYDPLKPINESPNNYGARELPVAQLPLIWYGYGASEKWPMLGTGSRSAMAGPIYYKTAKNTTSAFPDYYQGKLFIYEWARSWIKTLSFNARGELMQIESFLPNVEISKPIDLEFGPDGALYVLAYGANYFADNEDARLIKIAYAEGNRPPVSVITANKTVGQVPLEISFNTKGSFDFDRLDSLHYRWLVDGSEVSKGASLVHIFNEPGEHQVSLWARDEAGDSTQSSITIRAGNAPPLVNVALTSNRSFYFAAEQHQYQVTVVDMEDGSTEDGTIPASDVVINFNYLPQGEDLANLGADLFKRPTQYLVGRRLIDGSDCATCHDYQAASRGPSYQAIAQRYFGDDGSIPMLAQKIITGGSGSWGNTLMAAHPQHSEEETIEMAKYIVSLASEASNPGLALNGVITTNAHDASDSQGKYLFTAYYRDRGHQGATPLESFTTFMLRAPLLQAEDYHQFQQVAKQRPQGGSLEYISSRKRGSYIVFQNIDLKNITHLTFRARAGRSSLIRVHLDEPAGLVWSEARPDGDGSWQEVRVPVQDDEEVHDLYIVFDTVANADQMFMELDWIQMESNRIP